MFFNDDLGGADVSEESDHEEYDEEDLCEDDMFVDYGRQHVPTDVEGMKQYVAACLKKACELVELADEVLDEGRANNPSDTSFMELKELWDQMFAVPTYTQQQRDYPEENDNTRFSFRTPENGGKQFPYTQMYGSPT